MPPDDKTFPRVLFVEGSDDLHVVLQLCLRSESVPEFRIVNRDGKDNLLKTISDDIDTPGRVAVGIVMDANDNLAARWQTIKNRIEESDIIRENNIALPDKPDPSGTIIEGTRRLPRIGIWLMPDNQSPGELEDFIKKMIPDGDSVWPRSESYIDGIPEGDRKFTEGKILRAKVHAWLATRREPRKMGQAITTRDLDISEENCQTFVHWLRELFK